MKRLVCASFVAVTLTAGTGAWAAGAAVVSANQAPVCQVREAQVPLIAGFLYQLPVSKLAVDPEGQPVRLISFTDNSVWQAGTARIDDNGTPKRRTDDSFVYQRPNPLGSLWDQKFSIVVGDGKIRTTCLLDITTPRGGGA